MEFIVDANILMRFAEAKRVDVLADWVGDDVLVTSGSVRRQVRAHLAVPLNEVISIGITAGWLIVRNAPDGLRWERVPNATGPTGIGRTDAELIAWAHQANVPLLTDDGGAYRAAEAMSVDVNNVVAILIDVRAAMADDVKFLAIVKAVARTRTFKPDECKTLGVDPKAL